MKSIFIPTKKNKYHAYLLRKPMLALYLVILIIINMIFGGLSMTYSAAAVDFTSLYKMHNEEREKRNLSELTINPLLINSATEKAKAMLDSNCWSHYCPDGKSPWDFFDDAGYVYVYAGENLAEGFVDNNAVMSAWLDSPTHRDNIVNTKFTEIGIGFAQGDYQGIRNNTIIVVHFGNRFDFLADKNDEPIIEQENSVVKITDPKAGDSFQDNDFLIKGESSIDSSIELFANEQRLANVRINNGEFVYRPSFEQFAKEGDYSITASLNMLGKVLTSNLVNITIDNTPPSISKTDLKISNSVSGYLIEINLPDAEQVKLVNLNVDFIKSGINKWQIFSETFDPNTTPSIVIAASDKAGNASSLEVRTASVLSESTSVNSQVGLFDGNTLFRFKNQTSIVNFSFLLFMSGLFGIDYFVLQKNGLTGKQRSHSHLNVLLFIVLAIIVLLGSSTGDILTGITIT